MKRILLFAPLLAIFLTTCHAGVVPPLVADSLTVYDSSNQIPANIVDQILVNSDGTTSYIGAGLGISGGPCVTGEPDPCAFYYIEDSSLADNLQLGSLDTLYNGAVLSDLFGVYYGDYSFGVLQTSSFAALGFFPHALDGTPSPYDGATGPDCATSGDPTTCPQVSPANEFFSATTFLNPSLTSCGGGDDDNEGGDDNGGGSCYTAQFYTDAGSTAPEPASLFLLGGGLAVLALRKLRRT